MTTPDEHPDGHQISIGVILRAPANRVDDVLDSIAALPGVRVVYSRIGGARSLWIREDAP